MYGKLNIGTAGFDANFPDNINGRITHPLVFLVGQCLSRRYSYGIPRVNSHGIKVFDGTDDNNIVCQVPHDLEFKFFPAQQRLFDQNLMYGRNIQTSIYNRLVFLSIKCCSSASASERKTGPDDSRKAYFL